MKLPIFYAEDRPSLHLLERAAKRVGFVPFLFHFRDIEVSLSKSITTLKVRGHELQKFPLIFVREIRNYVREAVLLAKFCYFKNIPLFDSALLETREGSKIDLLLRRAENHLPIPKTIFVGSSKSLPKITRHISFPLVAKENRGRQGRNVYLIKNKSELRRFFLRTTPLKKTLDSPSYLFQEFIPCDSDIRVLVLGNKVLGAMERRSQSVREFRHNVALGAVTKQIPVTAEMKKLALAAAKVARYEFAGVDLIRHRETGKLFILEANRSPEFEGFMEATGIDVPGEVMKFFLRFLGKKIQ